MILYKTAKAVEELASAKRSLSILQRRALLLADGNRQLEDIRAGINRPDSAELLYLLIRQGYLSQDRSARQTLQTPIAVAAPPIPDVPKAIAAEIEAPVSAENRNAILVIVRQTSTLHLGLFAQDILGALDRADSDRALRNCISRWHVAMLDSRSGREVALDALQEVNDLLKGPEFPADSAAA
ncbi:MAG: hypothetical protein RIQ43_527 [Pseudomonadota bacterium]|jgi:hypothetical protein